MAKKWIEWINLSAALVGILILLAILWIFWINPSDFPSKDVAVRKTEIPKGAFLKDKTDYEAIGAPVFTLRYSPMSMQIPDLRRYLVYYGRNGRPDVKTDKTLLHFSLTGSKATASVVPDEKLYLSYDKKQSPNQYSFSPNNAETPLWMHATIQGNQAAVKVSMKNDKGEIIHEPLAYAEFTLPEKEFIRFGGAIWEIGKWRVDGTLLARQKARWYGMDRFLEKHGGSEYKELEHKQRIDFGEGDDLYSNYVGLDDCMIWKDNRWHVVKAGTESVGFPLLCVKKIDERIMNLELWDVDGNGKVALNLLKSNESWIPQNLQQNFKFVGARTRSQFVFEVNKERMLLSPHDWLVLTDNVWKKLVTPEEIDEYVNRKITGPLFVFDGIERKDDHQVILGTMFNASRTEMAPIELPIQQSASSNALAHPHHEEKKKHKELHSPVVKTRESQESSLK